MRALNVCRSIWVDAFGAELGADVERHPIQSEINNMNITSLGESRFASPIQHPVSDKERIPAVIVRDPDAPPRDQVLFELAGPRANLFFDPAHTRAGIVTCGGLCP